MLVFSQKTCTSTPFVILSSIALTPYVHVGRILSSAPTAKPGLIDMSMAGRGVRIAIGVICRALWLTVSLHFERKGLGRRTQVRYVGCLKLYTYDLVTGSLATNASFK